MYSSPSSGRVVSVLPGRIRLRLLRPHHHQLESIRAHLVQQQGIRDVAVNQTTGSILVHCDRLDLSSENILGMVRDLGIFISTVEESTEEVPIVGQEDIGERFVSTVDDLDRRLSAAVGRNVDLKLIAPLAVGAVGLRQVIVEGLGQTSGLLMLWVAFDMFYKLHRRTRGPTRPAETVTAAWAAQTIGPRSG